MLHVGTKVSLQTPAPREGDHLQILPQEEVSQLVSSLYITPVNVCSGGTEESLWSI